MINPTKEKLILKKLEVGQQLTDEELSFYVALHQSRRCKRNDNGNTVSILLVEDSQEDFDAITRAFQKCGVTSGIHHARTAESALQFLRHKDAPRVDLILLDLNMRGLGGRKMLEVIKKDCDLQSLPVVIFTGSDAPDDVEMCYSFGASSYIKKPLEFDALVGVLQNLKDFWVNVLIHRPRELGR